MIYVLLLTIKAAVVNLGAYHSLDECLDARAAVERQHPNIPGILACVPREGA